MANTLRFKRGIESSIPTALAGEPLFTTDTFDLYIGNGTTNTRFQKYIASGATTQILRGDGSLYSFPLAISSPSNGQVLKYNGTSWVNDSDAGITGSLTTNYLPKATGATTLGNSLVFDNGTNVLVNTTTALWSASARQTFEVNGGSQTLIALNVANASAGYLWHSGTYLSLANLKNSYLSFVTNSSEVARFHSTGNFGIGTGASDTGEKLQVVGAARISTDLGIGMSPSAVSNNNSINIAGTNGTFYRAYTGATETFRIQTTSTTNFIQSFSGNLRFDAGAVSNAMTLFSTGNLVVASTGDTGEKLQVNGTMKVTGATALFTTTITSTTNVEWTNSLLVSGGANGDNSGTRAYFRPSGSFGAAIYGGRWSSTDRGARFVGISSGSVENTYIHLNGESSIMQLATAATVRATIDASGNLGLAVTPSAWGGPFKVMQLGTYGQYIAGQTNNADMKIGMNSYYNGTNYIYTTSGSVTLRYDFSANGYAWQIAPSGTAGNAITFTQAMTLDASGNLGVGLATHSSKFEVFKAANDTLSRANAAVGIGDFAFGAGLLMQQRVSAPYGFMVQATNSTAATFYPLLLQPNGGNVHIGGTSDSGELLQVTGTAKITGATAINAGLTVTNTGIAPFTGQARFINSTSGAALVSFENTLNGFAFGFNSTTTQRFVWINGVPTEIMCLTGTGNLGINTTSPSEKLHVVGNGIITGNLTVDTNTLFVDATNNRVGILTATPSTTLDVGGNATIGLTSTTGYSLVVQNSGANDTTGIKLTSGGTDNGYFITAYNSVSKYASLQAGDNLAYKNIVLNLLGGNVGIGISPTYKLHVSGTGYFTDNVRFVNDKGLLFENASASAVGSIKMGTSVTNNLEITNGTHTLSLVSLGTLVSSNFMIGAASLGTSATNTIAVYNGTAPTTSATDIFQMYSNDITAGNAAPHFRTENGAVIKLYQETTAVGNSTISLGGGNAVLDDTEFDGYTLRQLVKALRNQGILA